MIVLNAASVALSTSASPTHWFSSGVWGTQLNGTADADVVSTDGSYVTLVGGAADDTYCVWNQTNTILEQVDGGIDTLQSYTTRMVLPANVENLQVLWSNLAGIGNELDNIVMGSDGAQTLNGGAGNDVLLGGAGADQFIVAAGDGNDVIVDFTPGIDRIRLEGYALYEFGVVRAAMTQSGADVVLALGNGERLVLRDRQVADFAAADFALPINPAHPGMHQTFVEDFNAFSASATGVDSVWKTSLGIVRQERTLASNKEAEYYSDDSVGVNPFSLANGVLDIAATPGSNPLNLPYNSGVISTAASFAQQYGYFEARLDLPAGQGFWPAFWLLPASGLWPPEIDILEFLGHDPTTAYASVRSGASGSTTIPIRHLPDLSTGFHTYGLNWQAETITWTIDGNPVAQIATPADMHQPMYMLLNLAVGGAGSWPGPTDPSKPVAHMLIDYVRAWQNGEVEANVTGPEDVAAFGGVYTLKPDGVSDLYDFSKAKVALLMDAADLTVTGTHTVWGSALADTVRGGPGNVNLSAGAGNDTFTFGSAMSRVQGGAGNDTLVLVKGAIATGNQIVDFHRDLSNGTEHDMLRLQGFSAIAHLDLISAAAPGTAGQWQYYKVIDGTYVSPTIAINVTNGPGAITALDYLFT